MFHAETTGHNPVSPQLRVLRYEVKCLSHRTGRAPDNAGMLLKKKDLPSNKDVLGQERESGHWNIVLWRTRSPGDADVLRDAVDKWETWLTLPEHSWFC